MSSAKFIEKDVSPVGVVAYSVLSQIELAKLNNIELQKAIEVERNIEKLSLATNKLKSTNIEVSRKIKPHDHTLIKRMPLRDAHTLAKQLSDGFIWAERVLEEAYSGKYQREYHTYMDLLLVEIEKSMQLREKVDNIIEVSRVDMLSSQRQLQNSAQANELLEAEANELKKIVEGKLLLGALEQELYYITAEYKLRNEQSLLISRIFGAIANQPDVNVLIIGRADPRGNRTYNEDLARKRANEIVELAGKAAIAGDRITVESYVSSRDIQPNREIHFFDRNTTIKIWRTKSVRGEKGR